MYGAAGTDEAPDESSPFRPLTAYAESKVRSEEGLFWLSGPGFAVTSMGNQPSTDFRRASGLTSCSTVSPARATRPGVRLLSDGMAWRPLVHVRDLSKTAATILEAPTDSVTQAKR